MKVYNPQKRKAKVAIRPGIDMENTDRGEEEKYIFMLSWRKEHEE
jgi:hypothetical protein